MAPYVKKRTHRLNDGWMVLEGNGSPIALLDTELLADVVMQWLVEEGADPKRYECGVPYGDDENEDQGKED